MIFFIKIINYLCKQDQDKSEDNAPQSHIDTEAANNDQLEIKKMYLASASVDKTIKLWDLDSCQC